MNSFENKTLEQVLDTMYPAQKEAFLECINGEGDVLITAAGGYGKSYIIDALRHFAGDCTVVTGTTGVSAVNVKGSTVHSTLGLPLGIPTKENMKKVSKKFRSLFKRNHPVRNLVIDEFSFKGPQTFDSTLQRRDRISKTSRHKRVRLIVFGDFAQLLNVVKGQEKELVKEIYGSTILLNSNIFKEHDFKIFELDQNKRATDPVQQKMLEDMRLGDNLDEVVTYFNQRVSDPDPEAVYLCTTNKEVDVINQRAFEANTNDPMYYHATISGTFKVADTQIPELLILKEGLRVMALTNQQTEGDEEPQYVNGSVGTVVQLMTDSALVSFDNGNEVLVEAVEQENIEYYTDKEGELQTRKIGTFSNLGLKICYALTVHKAQGLSLEKANIDFGENGCFSYGQAYVSISRLTNMKGLHLIRPLFKSDIKVNRYVKKFYKELRGVEDNTFKLIIAGGRDFNDYQTLKGRLDNLLRSKNLEDIVIISGGAKGADSLGERYAKERCLRLEIYEAEWDRFGKRAGYLRNSLMADNADALVAFWNGSAGTGHMITLAEEQGLAVRVVNY